MDKARMGIRLERLRIPCVVGVYDVERHANQDLLLDLEMSLEQHPRHLGAGIYLDYAGLSAAITFFCQSANFGLLEDALVALDTLVWSLIPEEWLAHASVRIELRKPSALSDVGTPVVYGLTQMPSQRSVFIKGEGCRLARLAAWENGALWSYFSEGAERLELDVKIGSQLLLTQGVLGFVDDVLNVGESISVDDEQALVCQSSDGVDLLIYTPGQEVPLMKNLSDGNCKLTLRAPTSSLFDQLGIPKNETFRFNELIWAKAQHPHFAAELQTTPHDTDVAVKAAPPSVLRSS